MNCKYEYNGKFYTEQELANHPDFKYEGKVSPALERNFINNNTGLATDHSINLFSPSDESGIFVKFIQFKKSQLAEYNKRLKKIEAEKRKGGLSTDKLSQLNRLERELRLQTEGNHELGVKGLHTEISELVKHADTNAVGYYVNKDIERLGKLSASNNVDDLHEAQRVIDFYDLAGTFKRGTENPFFSQKDMFLNDEDGNLTAEYRLSDLTMNQYKDWRDQTGQFQNIINKRYEEITTNQVNTDPSVKRTYNGKNFTYDELVKNGEGLKDVDWVSMWTMDVTNGIFSHNGIVPQVMFSFLSNSFEKKLAWARGVEEKIDHMKPAVESELIKLGHSLRGGGIIGLKGASYQLYKEVTREGNETGGIVQRFVKEFFDQQSTAQNKFKSAFESAKLNEDYGIASRAFNKAFEELKAWKRKNTIIFDINKVPEINGDSDANKSYKADLIKLLGNKGYNEYVDKQKNQLNKYEAEKQSTIETAFILEGKSSYDELSDKSKAGIKNWENTHDPKIGIQDYNSSRGVFDGDRKINSYMNFNTLIPRKYNAVASVNEEGNYEFRDTTNPTGHYSDSFATIENNPVLSDFYDVMKEVCQSVKENMSLDLQNGITVNTLPGLKKSFAEIMADNNVGVLHSMFLAFRHMTEKMRLAFGVVKQSEVSYATLDPITGKANYKVNDQFLQGNSRAVSQRQDIERVKFLQAYNNTQQDKVKAIKRFSVLPLSNMNASALKLLADYVGSDISLADIQSKNLGKLRSITGENVEIGKYIRDFSMHSVVQSQSFDLAKIGKYYANMISAYSARQEALPILNIMKQHYEQIQKPKTNNLGNKIFNNNAQTYEMAGLRTNAIKQMDDWFERVALDNYGGQQAGVHGSQVRDIKDDEGNVKTKIPFYGKKIFSSEEKSKIKDINSLLKNESDEKVSERLNEIKAGFGKERTATAAFDNMFAWIRTLRLGYNLSSASTNFLEGVTSNMILGSSAEYFDPKEIFYGYHVIKHSFIKNVTFGLAETGLAKRNRSLMDKFNVIMDSKNELQKSSARTYASKFSWLNPHELNQRVEYINQSPILIAMLRTMKLKDSQGNESSMWDAFENDGHLKKQFATEENKKNWEDLNGDDYHAFKQKLHKAIVLGHGNYDELRGMMAKSKTAGRALMMFKTWLPMQFYWRFATQQDDTHSGTIGYKGRYFSYGKGSAAVHGAVAGTAFFGPLGTVIGGAIGAGFGAAFGTDSGVGMLRETIEATKSLALKIVGMPVNLLAGKQIISGGDKAFESFVGKGDFTTQDAKNMRGNMADVAMQLAWISLMLMVKKALWDDKDKQDDPERMAHNILINRFMALSSQAAMYVNPVDTYKSTIQSNGVLQYLTEVGKEAIKVENYFQGNDIIQSGIHAGQSALGNQTEKLTMPGIFKGTMFGFQSQAERVFEEPPIHGFFKNDETNTKSHIKRERAEYKNELEETYKPEDFEEPKERDKMIKKLLDERYPQMKKLQKMGLTEEEYQAQH